MTSITKTILMTFDNTTGVASAVINIPFPVKEIRIKQVSIDKTSSYTNLLGNALVYSSLVQNNVITILNMTSTVYQPFSNSVFTYTNPVNIQGDYTFSLFNYLGTPYVLALTQHNLGLMIEFIKF